MVKFRNIRSENKNSVEMICLLLSLSAIFFQIWILATSWESFLQGQVQRLLPGVIFSFLGLLVCGLTAWTTGMSFMKGMDEGRTRTYFKNTEFKKDSL
ncbi:MAG: hypothetical protein KGJ11_00085 [Candidatus Omnitrophica bacterium]|nr:hypothetical protein [Candidatus Omnitrophota bacterium]